jgi:ubiquinone/menaquinone biosynthesis C-methylase UbiE
MPERSFDSIKRHYIIEKELANKLKMSTKEQRKKLYASVYDELFQRVSDHPQLLRKTTEISKNNGVLEQLRFLRKFVLSWQTFLEIGAGDCQLSFSVAKHVCKVFAVDVSEEIANNSERPSNFELVLSDGTSIPICEESIDIAYSNQLIEHLHPEDALDQVSNIYRVLKSGGLYVCITSHRFSGPHDISKYFDKEAQGLHLKEYTYRELSCLMKNAGFKTVNIYIGGRGIFMRFPYILTLIIEKIFKLLPYKLRKKLSSTFPFKAFFGTLVLVVVK